MDRRRRDDLVRKIRSLLAKTVENGCTEDEAIEAARKASDLLAAYDIDLDEEEVRSTPFAETQETYDSMYAERLWKPASAIGVLTETRYLRSMPGVHPVVMTFFGLEHEVEIASYLMAICARAMKDGEAAMTEAAKYYEASARRRKTGAYLDGMADSLRHRILSLVPVKPPGTGLVVLKRKMVDDELRKRGTKVRRLRSRTSDEHDPSYEIGREAGDKVALNQGVGTSRGGALLSG